MLYKYIFYSLYEDIFYIYLYKKVKGTWCLGTVIQAPLNFKDNMCWVVKLNATICLAEWSNESNLIRNIS